MNRAELLANYLEFGNNIETLNSRDFYDLLGNDEIVKKITHRQPMFPGVDIMHIELDGWDYYSYGVVYSVGWGGDHDSDTYFFRIKRMTTVERENMMKILSHQNTYEENIAIQSDFYSPDNEELL